MLYELKNAIWAFLSPYGIKKPISSYPNLAIRMINKYPIVQS